MEERVEANRLVFHPDRTEERGEDALSSTSSEPNVPRCQGGPRFPYFDLSHIRNWRSLTDGHEIYLRDVEEGEDSCIRTLRKILRLIEEGRVERATAVARMHTDLHV